MSWWFLRFSPDGAHLAGGHLQIQEDGVIIGSGTSPRYADSSTIFYARQPDGAFMRWRRGVGSMVIREQGFNFYDVAPDGRYVGYRADPPRLIWHDGVEWNGWADGDLSNTRWAARQHVNSALWAGTGSGQDGRLVDARPCTDVRLLGDILVWKVGDRIYGQRGHGERVEDWSIEGQTHFWPVPVWAEGKLYVLTHTFDRLLFYEAKEGQTHGYIVSSGISDMPDAAYRGDGFLHVAWSDKGELGERVINLSDPTVDLRTDSPSPIPVLDLESTVDVLDFIPLGITLDGSHLFGFKPTGQQPNVFSLAKHTDGGGEWWAYDDTWIYHHLDQAASPIEEVIAGQFKVKRDAEGTRVDAYHFTPDARWMPRRVKTGDTITIHTKIVHQADGASDDWRHTNYFEVYSSWPTRHGSLPAFRIRYDPRKHRDPNGRLQGGYEWGTYARTPDKKLWHVTWEAWRTKNDNSGDEPVMFNGKPLRTEFYQVVNTRIDWKPSRRPAGASLLPTGGGGKVGVTFQEPAFPLNVKVGDKTRFVLKRDGDWPTRIRWWRRLGDRFDVTDWRNPQHDADHTWEWTEQGQFTVGIEWEGGGTGARREVNVAAHGGGGNPGGSGGLVALEELSDVHHRLESIYHTDPSLHPEQVTRVDAGGRIGWTHNYLGRRSKGTGHEAAIRAVENQIDEVEGRPPRWGGGGGGTIDPPPPPPGDLDRIDGQLQLEPGGGFHINGRPVLPTLAHYGDALSKWMRDRSHVLRNLDLMAGVGYHGIRYWTCLDGAWWAGRHVGEAFQPNYWEEHRAFFLALKERGLVAQISQGSTTHDALPDPHGFMNRLCDVLQDVGPAVCCVLEGVNEDRDTGNKGPRWLADFVGIARARLPQLLLGLSSYTGTEDPEILNQYSIDPANMFMVHPYRGGHNHDKTRHLMSLQYENGINARMVMAIARSMRATISSTTMLDDIAASRVRTALETADWLMRYAPHRQEEINRLLALATNRSAMRSAMAREAERLMRRNGWNSEGPGGGSRVSAIDNRDAMTGATMAGLAAMSFAMRMGYVWFSGVGVISDEHETFEMMPGFREVPQVRKYVPHDIMRYSGPVFHGGDTWRDHRTYAAMGDTRADHVVHSDGRRLVMIYGPSGLDVPQHRGLNVEVDQRWGNEFRLVFGRE